MGYHVIMHSSNKRAVIGHMISRPLYFKPYHLVIEVSEAGFHKVEVENSR